MKTIVFLLEEKSAKVMLEKLLPRAFEGTNVSFLYICFEGKQDLIASLERKMGKWLAPNTNFIVLIDQDGSDCLELKRKLLEICRCATSSRSLVRIACHELENWYLGDLSAVDRAFECHIATRVNERKYANPDHFANAPELLVSLTNHQYQKVNGSRILGEHIDSAINKSKSFQVFLNGIRQLIDSKE